MVLKNRVWHDIPVWFVAWSSMFSIGFLFVLYLAASLVRQRLSQQTGVPTETGFLFEIWEVLHRTLGISHQALLGALTAVTLTSVAINIIFWVWRRSKPAQVFYWLFYESRPWAAAFGFCASLVYILKLPFIHYLPGSDPDVSATEFVLRDGLFLAALGFLFAGLWLARPLQSIWLEEQAQKLRAGRERLGAALNRLPSLWSSLAVALLPVALVCAVIYGLWGARLSNYFPMFWNDAVGYWMWVRQFVSYGFGGGYNYPNELTPLWPFNHFGEGSPLYVYIYGAFGRLLGWRAHLPILVNFFLISLSLWVFSRRARLDTVQNLILGCALAVSWPLLVFLPTTFQETFNQAIGILFALAFLIHLRGEPISPFAKTAWILFGVLAALARLSWVILLYPLLFFSFSGTFLRRAGLALAAWLPIGALVVFVTRQLTPPINNSIFRALGEAGAGGFRVFAVQFVIQARYLLKYKEMTPSLLVVILMLVLAGASLVALVRLRRAGTPWREIFHTQEAFDAYNMLLLLAAGMTLYIAQGFYRVFFAALLVSLLMRVAQRRYGFIRFFIVMNLFFAPVMLNYYSDWDWTRKAYTTEWPELEQSRPAMTDEIVFDETAENPWCNTILIPIGLYDGRLTSLPAGIGVSYISYYPLTHPVQSKYLLLDPETYAILTREYGLQAELLASLPIGDLYQNLEADCLPSR